MSEDLNLAGTEAEQLAAVAAAVTYDTAQLLAQLAEILVGFKQAVHDGGQVADAELGDSLRGILRAVEQMRAELDQVASLAVAMSTVRLAQMAESLRRDIQSLMQAGNKDPDSS